MAEKKIVKATETPKVDNSALNAEALVSRLTDLKKNAMNLRFQHAAGQLPKTHEIRKNRREVARVKTALTAVKK
ncbi:MAG: 50S ribosomal protein L29 [Alphaproteobacteria bacterium]|nr:50S ribosomal protein L29 [Alphaproteobacteria bacterium]